MSAHFMIKLQQLVDLDISRMVLRKGPEDLFKGEIVIGVLKKGELILNFWRSCKIQLPVLLLVQQRPKGNLGEGPGLHSFS